MSNLLIHIIVLDQLCLPNRQTQLIDTRVYVASQVNSLDISFTLDSWLASFFICLFFFGVFSHPLTDSQCFCKLLFYTLLSFNLFQTSVVIVFYISRFQSTLNYTYSLEDALDRHE